MPVALGGQVGDRAQPLGKPAEREEGMLRRGQPRRVLLGCGLKLGLAQPGLGK